MSSVILQKKVGTATTFIAVADGIQALAQAKLVAMEAAFESWANDTATQMQRDARWTDRTGDARRGLVAILTNNGTQGGLATFQHSVVYGRYLEFAFGGRYAIVFPTLAQRIPILYADFQRIWSS